MMTSGMTIKQREIIFVPFPFSDLSSRKRRLALVLSPSNHNSKNEDIICCALTSNPRSFPDSVKINNSDLDSGSLTYESVVKPLKLFSLSKYIIISSIAKLNKIKSKTVVGNIKTTITIVE